jgi:hypothetical protein
MEEDPMWNAKSLLAAASFGMVGIGQVQAQVIAWTGPNLGNWSTGANWAGGLVPSGAVAVARFDAFSGQAMLTGAVAPIGAIEVLDPAATVNIEQGGTLTLTGGASVNSGLIVLNRVGSASNALFSLAGPTVIAGTGEIRMRTSADNSQITGVGPLTNGPDHTIRGVGQVFTPVTNDGLIAADIAVSVSGVDLEIHGDVSNNGVLASDNTGSILEIVGAAITQTPTAQIVAQDGNIVFFPASSVAGGIVTDTGAAGRVFTSGAVTLDSVDHSGTLTTVQQGSTLSIIGAGIVNDGVIQLNPVGSASNALMVFDQSGMLTGAGEVRMRTSADNSQINTGAGQSITHTAGHTIRGVGQINAALANAGVIAADVSVSVSGTTLELQTANKTNPGTLLAMAGSVLNIESIAVDQAGGGLIHADDGGTVALFGPASILGGAVTGDPTGAVAVRSGSVTTLDGVALDAPVTIDAGGTVAIGPAGISNNGVIQLNPIGSASNALLTAPLSTSITGAGEIRMRTFADNSQITASPGAVLTHAASHTIRGVGQISAEIINDGLIAADVSVSVSGTTLELLSGGIDNNGQIGALAGSALFVTGIAIDQTGGGSLSADAGAITVRNGASIIGGTLGSINGGSWSVSSSASVDGAVLSGAGTILLGSALTILGPTLANDAAIAVNPVGSASDSVVQLTEDTTLTGSGGITFFGAGADARISPAAMLSPTLTNGTGHTLAGLGAIQVPLVNMGTLRPGTPLGVMAVSGAVTLDTGGSFVATIAGNASNGRLTATAPIALAGTLDIQLAPAATLANGNNHTIISAPSITGQFDTVNVLTSGQLITRVVYEPTQVVLRTRCRADVNLDASVTPADFSAWIGAFNAMNPAADQNLDGLITPADFSSWIQNFNTPCP